MKSETIFVCCGCRAENDHYVGRTLVVCRHCGKHQSTALRVRVSSYEVCRQMARQEKRKRGF